ncbi:hypothetical protein [Methylomonas albis]|uniref:PEP-CTERM protein-sorting domain-containing protein n=1 Tax=Methylomonas albis TaxID=1854563 RepID=A0ABR9CZ79_9GAMM|nr:hypothetical protein [Methylomonas albis]MBD9355283.1 hypothetical protein [Methylomonas albis]
MQNSKPNLRTAAIASVFLLSLSATAEASVALSGFVKSTSPASFSIADLQGFGSTSTVTVGGNTYTGVSLYSYLNSYVDKDPAAKNDILRDYVVATGTSGSTVYTMGNLLGSGFGTQNDIIAFSDSQGLLSAPSLIAADGASVSALTSLNIGHVAYQGSAPGGASTSFSIGGAVSSPANYTAADLPGSLSPTTVFNKPNGSALATGGATGFTGVSLYELLVSAGISNDPAALLRSYVIATGTDNYTAVYALEEIMPQFGNQGDLLAYADGIGGALGGSGFARTVVPGDLKGGRFMSNLNGLTVVTLPAAVPVPPAAILMLSGLFGIACSSRRKRWAA